MQSAYQYDEVKKDAQSTISDLDTLYEIDESARNLLYALRNNNTASTTIEELQKRIIKLNWDEPEIFKGIIISIVPTFLHVYTHLLNKPSNKNKIFSLIAALELSISRNYTTSKIQSISPDMQWKIVLAKATALMEIINLNLTTYKNDNNEKYYNNALRLLKETKEIDTEFQKYKNVVEYTAFLANAGMMNEKHKDLLSHHPALQKAFNDILSLPTEQEIQTTPVPTIMQTITGLQDSKTSSIEHLPITTSSSITSSDSRLSNLSAKPSGADTNNSEQKSTTGLISEELRSDIKKFIKDGNKILSAKGEDKIELDDDTAEKICDSLLKMGLMLYICNVESKLLNKMSNFCFETIKILPDAIKVHYQYALESLKTLIKSDTTDITITELEDEQSKLFQIKWHAPESIHIFSWTAIILSRIYIEKIEKNPTDNHFQLYNTLIDQIFYKYSEFLNQSIYSNKLIPVTKNITRALYEIADTLLEQYQKENREANQIKILSCVNQSLQQYTKICNYLASQDAVDNNSKEFDKIICYTKNLFIDYTKILLHKENGILFRELLYSALDLIEKHPEIIEDSTKLSLIQAEKSLPTELRKGIIPISQQITNLLEIINLPDKLKTHRPPRNEDNEISKVRVSFQIISDSKKSESSKHLNEHNIIRNSLIAIGKSFLSTCTPDYITKEKLNLLSNIANSIHMACINSPYQHHNQTNVKKEITNFLSEIANLYINLLKNNQQYYDQAVQFNNVYNKYISKESTNSLQAEITRISTEQRKDNEQTRKREEKQPSPIGTTKTILSATAAKKLKKKEKKEDNENKENKKEQTTKLEELPATSSSNPLLTPHELDNPIEPPIMSDSKESVENNILTDPANKDNNRTRKLKKRARREQQEIATLRKENEAKEKEIKELRSSNEVLQQIYLGQDRLIKTHKQQIQAQEKQIQAHKENIQTLQNEIELWRKQFNKQQQLTHGGYQGPRMFAQPSQLITSPPPTQAPAIQRMPITHRAPQVLPLMYPQHHNNQLTISSQPSQGSLPLNNPENNSKRR